jgi:hypothetical protein
MLAAACAFAIAGWMLACLLGWRLYRAKLLNRELATALNNWIRGTRRLQLLMQEPAQPPPLPVEKQTLLASREQLLQRKTGLWKLPRFKFPDEMDE